MAVVPSALHEGCAQGESFIEQAPFTQLYVTTSLLPPQDAPGHADSLEEQAPFVQVEVTTLFPLHVGSGHAAWLETQEPPMHVEVTTLFPLQEGPGQAVSLETHVPFMHVEVTTLLELLSQESAGQAVALATQSPFTHAYVTSLPVLSQESAGQVAVGAAQVPPPHAYRTVPLPSQAKDGQHMPPSQTFPHAPQLVVELGATHLPSQKMAPALQHPPLVHVCPSAQCAPQVPQFAWSLPRSTHSPPHDVCPSGQPQAPAEQVSPAEHAWPQAPQLSGSV